MKSLCKILLAVMVLALYGMSANARGTIEAAFKTAPAEVFPLIDKSARLDMIDYYGSTNNIGAENALSGRSRITEIVPGSMRIAMTSASRYQLVDLPVAADTLIAVISTILTPAPDSKMAIYGSDWTPMPTEKIFKVPELKDWMTSQGKKNKDEVEILVPFMLIGYDFNPETKTLTLINNMSSFLSKEVYEKVQSCFCDKLEYRWNGKKFMLVK